MTTEEANKQADEYVEIFLDMNIFQFTDVLRIWKSTQCAIRLVNTLIKYSETWGDLAVEDVKNFEKIKECLTNRLK